MYFTTEPRLQSIEAAMRSIPRYPVNRIEDQEGEKMKLRFSAKEHYDRQRSSLFSMSQTRTRNILQLCVDTDTIRFSVIKANEKQQFFLVTIVAGARTEVRASYFTVFITSIENKPTTYVLYCSFMGSGGLCVGRNKQRCPRTCT